MEIPQELILSAVVGVGGFVTYVVKTLLDQYRASIDRNSDILKSLEIAIAKLTEAHKT